MSEKYLKINNRCSENWDAMKPKKSGNYCDVCAKVVIDFTKLSQQEISKRMVSKDVCARVSKSQLLTPIFEIKPKNKRIPYSKVASSILIASSLLSTQPANANIIQNKIEINASIKTNNNKLKKKDKENSSKISTEKSDILFKGKVLSNMNKPIENAKISFITIHKIYSTYSKKDGTFKIKIPQNILDNDNVLRVSYSEIIKEEKSEPEFRYGYETTDLILSKKDVYMDYVINAKPERFYLGDISYTKEIHEPIVINNGKEEDYKEFIKAQQGKKSSCNLENKDFYYFEPKIAIALYGNKAKYGLYLFLNK